MEVTLQSIFNDGFANYISQHGISTDQLAAAKAIVQCGSDELGYDQWGCLNDEHTEQQNHSCKHRSCPRCNVAITREWLEKTKARLLPCNHYHVVFTLPHELGPIWHYNRHWCSDRLHKASSETLSQLLSDERYLGAEVGILSSLHTWGRTLSFHPHVHVLVTGGGLKNGEWKALKKDFLLPVGVIKSKFRGKWISWLNDAYARREIKLAPDWTEASWKKMLRHIARKSWNIRIQGAYEYGDGVVTYLSRYVRGGPIKNHALIAADSNAIEYKYLDYRDEKVKAMRLTPENFMSRVLWHVPCKGQHNIRYYGLYVPGAREKRSKIRSILGHLPEIKPSESEKKERLCPICGDNLVRQMSVRRRNSYIKNHHVQQSVQPDTESTAPMGNLHSGSSPGGIFFARAGAG